MQTKKEVDGKIVGNAVSDFILACCMGGLTSGQGKPMRIFARNWVCPGIQKNANIVEEDDSIRGSFCLSQYIKMVFFSCTALLSQCERSARGVQSSAWPKSQSDSD